MSIGEPSSRRPATCPDRPRAPGLVTCLSLLAALPLLAGGCDEADTVTYRGEINAQANRRFLAQVAGTAPRRLITRLLAK